GGGCRRPSPRWLRRCASSLRRSCHTTVHPVSSSETAPLLRAVGEMQADRLVGLVGLKPGNGPPGGDRPTAKVLGRRFELATGGSRVADASARNNPLQGLPDRTC